MRLPDFLWLWRIAAWSMGLASLVYGLLAVSGLTMRFFRQNGSEERHSQNQDRLTWLRPLHFLLGETLVVLVLVLLAIGIIGTLGHFGSLGHSIHLPAGLSVVALVLTSAWSASQIAPERPWARSLHLTLNGILFFGFIWVSLTGWSVVQKYLP